MTPIPVMPAAVPPKTAASPLTDDARLLAAAKSWKRPFCLKC